MDELTQQLAALEVVEMLRRSKRMPLPAAELVPEFGKLACQTMRRSFDNSEKIPARQIVSFFGLKPRVVAKFVSKRRFRALFCGLPHRVAFGDAAGAIFVLP